MSDPIQLSIEGESTISLSPPVINQIIEGISPTVDVEEVTGGHTVTITDKNGDHEFTVLNGTNGIDGDPGEDGVSPVAVVSKEGSVATISITDATGTTEVTVSDGEDGETPVRGTDYWTAEDQAAVIEDVEEAIIDDTAGDGDTNVTWSADKLVDEFDAKADVSDIPDVSGFYTKPAGGIPSSDMASAVQTSLGKADTAYQKPSGGIPATDIASGVIPSISGKADKVVSATNGNFAGLDSNGNLTDSGHKHSDYLTSHQDISGKLDAPSTAGTSGQVLTSDGDGGQTWETPTAPTSIIDDNAGDGDTTKVWSADKLHDEVSTLNGAINVTAEFVGDTDTDLGTHTGTVDTDITNMSPQITTLNGVEFTVTKTSVKADGEITGTSGSLTLQDTIPLATGKKYIFSIGTPIETSGLQIQVYNITGNAVLKTFNYSGGAYTYEYEPQSNINARIRITFSTGVGNDADETHNVSIIEQAQASIDNTVAYALADQISRMSDVESGLNTANGNITTINGKLNTFTPYQLGMGEDKGYISGTTSFSIDRASLKQRAIFAWLRCGKGTKVSVDTTVITGLQIRKYNILTGEYIENLGTLTSTNPVTVDEESVILIYVNTGYTDVGDYYSTINSAIRVEFVEPSVIVHDYPSVFEYGQIDTSTGKNGATATNRLRTQFVLLGAGTKIYQENTHARLNILRYGMDEAKGYIGASGNYQNPVYVVPDDAYIRLLGVNWRDNSFASASEIKPKIVYNEPSSFHLPSYYNDNSYIGTRRDNIISHQDACSYNGLTFAFITDVHWDTNNRRSPALLRYLKENTALKDVIFNGDGITSYNTKTLAIKNYNVFREAFSDWQGVHWMPVIGNHELNNPGATAGNTAQLTPSEAYGMVVKENERIITRIDEYSYYIDFTTVKVRIVFVGSDYQSLIPSATQTAVVSAINATPQDYKILVCSHIGLTGKSATGEIETTFQSIVTALDTVHDKVIGVLSGHRHADGHIQTEAGVHIIATTCDATTEGGGLTRTLGTTGENAFDVVQIDLTNNKMYLERIGAGSARSYDICE